MALPSPPVIMTSQLWETNVKTLETSGAVYSKQRPLRRSVRRDLADKIMHCKCYRLRTKDKFVIRT